ncbi:MAG: hypothetical protein A3I20_01155 [Candidatus Portnoybacteria bacterium RIFCSPLOWO2_02_FULL_40_15]|uniref:DUF5667 domain-containing protein n=1 Tax=Candidatus Portnoybacteria bacterium RIFCSPLOWO2_02_FULL_40_15 TaxID=1802002 RepID=A0A1G2FTP0_9BACT|nr:MAG: hypothetical protein A3I20_01155 [Candidatus Portnoybacteria bacterium RIFCSPLOWO2_02_FULL_40_15]
MKKFIDISFLISLLVFAPFISQASFTDNFFNDFEKRFLEKEISNTITTSSQSDVVIKNQINVSANTGGNIGEQTEETGNAKVEIEIQNEINGETLEPINIEKEEQGQANVSVEQNIQAPNKNNKALIETEIKINENTETRKTEIDLENSENKDSGEINSKETTKTENSSSAKSETEGSDKDKKQEEPKQILKKISEQVRLVNQASRWWDGFFKNLKLKLANILNIWRK